MNKLETLSPAPRTAYALLVVTTAILGAGIVVGRGVHEEIPPIGLAFWRVMVAVALLAPLVAGELKRLAPIIKRHWRLIVVLGILQIWPQAVILVALNHTTAINATLINGAQPAITAMLTAVLLRDRIGGWQAMGIAAALAGIVVMVSRGNAAMLAGLAFNVGDALVVAAILLWSLYAISVARLPREIGLTTMLFLVNLIGGVTLLPFYVMEAVYVRPTLPTLLTVSTVVWMGIVISAVSVFVWNMSLRALGPHRATIFLNLIPAWAALFAVVFLGENIHLYHVAGAVLVCGGITLVIKTARWRRDAVAAHGAET